MIIHLELIKCDITQSLMTNFIEVLTKNNRKIEKLKLSSFVFNKPMACNLGNFVIENFSLKKINLSWSEMMSDDLLLFMDKIKEIKHLQDLDISKIPIEGINRIKVVEMIKECIINNTSLIHLNMSCCNLLPDQLEILVKGIKKSKSLLAVHLSGNNLNEKGKKLLLDYLCRKKKKKDMFFQVNEDEDPDSPRTVVSMVSNRFDKSRLQAMKYDLYKQNQQKKLGLVLDNRANFETVDDRIVVYRHLGHFEIKNGYMWKIHSSCWICDQWKYTCVITNPATIEGTFKDYTQINTKYYHQKIKNSNTEKDFKKLEDSVNPIITGTFSKWKCKEMMKIDKFYD